MLAAALHVAAFIRLLRYTEKNHRFIHWNALRVWLPAIALATDGLFWWVSTSLTDPATALFRWLSDAATFEVIVLNLPPLLLMLVLAIPLALFNAHFPESMGIILAAADIWISWYLVACWLESRAALSQPQSLFSNKAS